MNPRLDWLADKAHNLTLSPGVYLMKNEDGEIIYVGKAKALKNRVSSYFQPNNPSHNEKVKKMVSQVYDFDYIVVDSEHEALVLECSLIKQNKPKYNILLKDDKGYHYIKITKDAYPRITAEHVIIDEKKADYLGPFVSSFSVRQSVEEANKIFKLPTCNRKFPQDFRKERPCLNFHIKQCLGICRGRVSQADYGAVMKQAVQYIKSGGKAMFEGLVKEMEEAAEALNFERAAALRDRINAIKKISTSSQKVVMINVKTQDVIAFAQNGRTVTVAILLFRNSQLVDKQDFVLTGIYDVSEAREEFLNQYYISSLDIPERILIDEDFAERELLEEFLSEKQGKKVSIVIPQKGENRKLIEMAYQNAGEKLSKFISRTSHEVTSLEELKKLLGLTKTPEYIEAYDISNIGESDKVGGMVVFENGRPQKKAYKKFKIKDVLGQDDYGSMQEVLRRRFNHYLDENEKDEGFNRLPDLILLDGGKGHVATITPMLRKMGIDVPIFGMVKDSRHRTRAIAADEGEIMISGSKLAFNFVTGVQDEVHRYAINYQKTSHKKTTLQLTLTRIDGIGDKKAVAILKSFKTKEKLKAATVEELMKTAKVKEEIAKLLHDFIAEAF